MNQQEFTHVAALNSTSNPVLRRQILDTFIDACRPPELLYLVESISPRLKRDFFGGLPTELALHILSFVEDPWTLNIVSEVNKRCYELGRDDTLWQRACFACGFDDWEDIIESGMSRDLDRFGLGLGSPRFSFRDYFRYSYLTRQNWRKGGRILKEHRLSILEPDNGSVTSFAMDDEWIVIGRSNSLINIYSAKTGVLTRTLVGHDAGVWGVCLVSRGGVYHDGLDSEKSSRAHHTHEVPINEFLHKSKGKRNSKCGRPPSSSSSSHLNPSPLSPPRLSPSPHRQDGIHVQASDQHTHDRLLRPYLRVALGLPEFDTHEEEEGSESSSSESSYHSAHEDPRSSFGTERFDGSAFGREPGNMTEGGAAPQNTKPASRPNSSSTSASDGWGQPNAIIVSGGCDKVVRVWDVESGTCIFVLHGHTSTIRCLRLVPNQPIAITGSRDDTLRVWDIQRGRCLGILQGHQGAVRCLDVCNGWVVSGSYDTTCKVWALPPLSLTPASSTTLHQSPIHTLTGHLHQIYCVAFNHPSGTLIASGGLDTTIRLWDTETGSCIALLQGHRSLVCALRFGERGLLVSAGSDGSVVTFDSRVSALESSSGNTYGLRGRTINGEDEEDSGVEVDGMKAKKANQKSEYKVMHRIAAHDSFLACLQVDEKEGWLVTAGNDGHVRLFDLGTRKGSPLDERRVLEEERTTRVGWSGLKGKGTKNTGNTGKRLEARRVRDLCEPADCVWKVGFTKDHYVVLCKRGKKTVVEIWSLRPSEV